MKYDSIKDLLDQSGVSYNNLPEHLKRLHDRLEDAVMALSDAPDDIKEQLAPILFQTGEIFASEIQALKINVPSSTNKAFNIDKQKQLELEAQARLILLKKRKLKGQPSK